MVCADVEVYRVVTAKGLKPLPGFKSLCLSTYTIDSVVDDATYGESRVTQRLR